WPFPDRAWRPRRRRGLPSRAPHGRSARRAARLRASAASSSALRRWTGRRVGAGRTRPAGGSGSAGSRRRGSECPLAAEWAPRTRRGSRRAPRSAEPSTCGERIIGGMTLAERLAEFAVGLEFEDLPADVVASVRLRALDILGIALASSTSELAPSVLGALEGWGGGACSVVGSSLTAAPPLAALANGALAHGLDFDDTHAVSITHAS